MREFGGEPQPLFDVFRLYPVATQNGSGTGGNAGGGRDANTWQVEVMADAAKVTFRVLGSTLPYRFLVQGPETGGRLRYVDRDGTIPDSASGTHWITLDFGARATRRVIIEGEQAQAMDGVYVGATETLWRTEGADLLRGLWLTDSYGTTVVGGRGNDSFANVMGAALGIRDRRVTALSSRGWVSDASGSRYTIGESIAVDAVPQAPDVGFICAGINDAGLSGAAITAEVTARIAEWRGLLPRAPLFVFGAWPGQSGPGAAILAAETAIAAGVAAAADPLTAFVPISTDPDAAWISGTGKLGATDGTGNADLYVSADGTHPPAAGHLYLGLRSADAVMSRLHGLA